MSTDTTLDVHPEMHILIEAKAGLPPMDTIEQMAPVSRRPQTE